MSRVLSGGEVPEVRFPEKPRYGYPVDPEKAPSYEEALALLLRVEGLLRGGSGSAKRLAAAKAELAKANAYEVYTHNMLNPEAGLFPIEARAKDSCCDPARELYHTM